VSTPRLSVIMPVRDAQRHLAEAVESVLRQRFADFEFLVWDDGSTDASLAMLRRFAERDPRVKVASGPPRGYAEALNDLLARAAGEYVARMDADDVCLPDRFARQVEFLDRNPDVMCVGTATDRIDARGRWIGRRVPPQDDAAIQQELLSGHNPIVHPSVLMRADAARAVGGYAVDLMPAEDLDLWLRLGERGRLANLSEVLFRYRMHPDSVSERSQAAQLANKRLAAERAWQRRGLPARELHLPPWRALDDRRSRADFLQRYGWSAFHLGEWRTAFAYGLALVGREPLRSDGWRLALCALFKTPPPERRAAALGSD
jgi:glycosyltransferase involved in cell wall biosynthesis